MRSIYPIYIFAICTAFFCLAGAGPLKAQENIKRYATEHVVPLSTISPDSAEDAGLAAIGKAIGDARVVFLGEQDHGDAPTFLAKTRLIKYLHEKMGFNVLAFESDFYSLTEGWERLPKRDGAIDTFVRYNIFPIWTGCDACKELFYDYLPRTFKTGSPLQLAGVDNQMVMRYSVKNLVPWLDSVMRELDLPVTHRADYATVILPMVDSARHWALRDTAQGSKIAAVLDTISDQASVRLQPDDHRMMVIRNLVAEEQEYRVFKSKKLAVKTTGTAEARDRQMGRNLAWLADVRYPNEKIIVWAAQAHTARMAGNFPDWSGTTPSLGDQFMQDSVHRRESYSIGVCSREGKAGRLGFPVYDLPKLRKDGFEHWMPDTLAYGFVDFRGYNQANPEAREAFYCTGYSHRDIRAVWNRVFDGVIYIKTMYPCVR